MSNLTENHDFTTFWAVENNGAKNFALRPLGGVVFWWKYLVLDKTVNYVSYHSLKTCPWDPAKNSFAKTYLKIYEQTL